MRRAVLVTRPPCAVKDCTHPAAVRVEDTMDLCGNCWQRWFAPLMRRHRRVAYARRYEVRYELGSELLSTGRR